MSEEISRLFLERLGNEVLEVLRQHDVHSELEYSITSDVLFSVTAALDDKEFVSDGKLNIDDGLHELVFGFVEDWYQPEGRNLDLNRMVFDLEILREKGKIVETNFMAHWIERPDLFKENLEIAMGCRAIEEIDKEITEKINERFKRRNKRAGNVNEIRIRLAESFDSGKWDSFAFPVNEFGEFENSLDGLSKCILEMAKKYA